MLACAAKIPQGARFLPVGQSEISSLCIASHVPRYENYPPIAVDSRRSAVLRALRRSRLGRVLQFIAMVGLILQPMPATSYWTDSNNDGTPDEVADPPEGDSWWSEDSDGDGMTNAEEAAFLSDPYRLDSDFDGLTDKDERDLTPPVLFGGLAHTDPWDWDSDDDGYSDHDEYFYTLQGRSPDVHYPSLSGGTFYSYYDADGDGLHNQDDPDPTTMDRDGDGILNWQDSYMDDYYNGNQPPTDPWFYADNDNDGTINGNDPYPDDPWNGQPHYYWNGSEHPGAWSDQDGDGIPDDFDPSPVPGYTYNGIFYAGDWSDRDNDGVPDPADPSPDGNYWYNGQEYPGPWEDGDNDGIPNPADPIDSTNSHWYNGTEYAGPFSDTDGDSIPDSADSWPDDPENGYDADGDGLDNYTETHNTQTNPNDVDSDDDYLTDGEEALVTHTNPTDPTTGASQTLLDFFVFSGPDTDSDGLPDLVERHYASDPSAFDAVTWLTPGGDLDGDGVTNLQAYWFGWDLLAYLNQYDMDGDGMTDAQEDYWNAIHPGIMDKAVFADAVTDPDGDGLMNYEELGMGTDPGQARSLHADVADGQLRAWWDYTATPYQWGYDWSLMIDPWSTPVYLPCPAGYLENNDWDGNGLPDGYDLYVASYGAPPVPAPVPPDADGDGMDNVWEHRHGLRMRDARDAQAPASPPPAQPQPGDYIDWAAYQNDYPNGGGEPLHYVNAGSYQTAYHQHLLAAHEFQSSPGCDPDGDTLNNFQEHALQSHPRIADSDGDGMPDGVEVDMGKDPKDPSSVDYSWVVNRRITDLESQVQALQAALFPENWDEIAYEQAMATRSQLLQALAQLRQHTQSPLPGTTPAQSAGWTSRLDAAQADLGNPTQDGEIFLEAQRRATFFDDSEGLMMEDTAKVPTQFSVDATEVVSVATEPWATWPADVRGESTSGGSPVDPIYFAPFGWGMANLHFERIRAFRTEGRRSRSVTKLLRTALINEIGAIVEQSISLVVFGFGKDNLVSESVAVLPLSGSVPSWIGQDGGMLTLAPTCPNNHVASAMMDDLAGAYLGYPDAQGVLTGDRPWAAQSVPITKWLGAYDPSPPAGLPQFSLANLQRRDADAFVIRMFRPDLVGTGSMTVQLGTTHPSGAWVDPLNDLELVEIPGDGGVFESMPLALVADADDDQKTPGEETENDVTHLAVMGGRLVVVLPEGVPIEFPVDQVLYELDIHFLFFATPTSGPYVFNNTVVGDVPINPLVDYRGIFLEQRRWCKWIYAQQRIHVRGHYHEVTAPLGSGLAAALAAGSFDVRLLKGELESTFGSLAPPNHLMVAFVPCALGQPTRAGEAGSIFGESGQLGLRSRWAAVSIPWLKIAPVKKGTTAHECGHLLGIRHEFHLDHHLMQYGGGWGIDRKPLLDGKRWSFSDVEMLLMLQSPWAQDYLTFVPLQP